MIELTTVDAGLLKGVDMVVSEITRKTNIPAESLMIVGATCRDILHSAFGHEFPVRATTDIDFGIITPTWDVWEKIERNFRHLGSNGIRYEIAGIPVDIMPFGPIEDPEGRSLPRSRNEEIVVSGFRDVYIHSQPLTLPSEQQIKIPHPAGYGALKLRSWLERSPNGEYKDAGDLALLTYWYSQSPVIENRIFTSSGDTFDLYQECDFDVLTTAARLLVFDIREQLSKENYTQLSADWHRNHDNELLEREFRLPSEAVFQYNPQTRLTLVEQLRFL